MKKFKRNVALENDISEIKKLSEEVESLARSFNYSDEIKNDINVALEEALANIIYYGYNDDGQHMIDVVIDASEDEAAFTISDDGIPFNPLEKEAPKTDLPLRERPVGGMGIHLIRNAVDEINYARENKRNVLTLKKTTKIS